MEVRFLYLTPMSHIHNYNVFAKIPERFGYVHLNKYVDYIRNTGMGPLAVHLFDEDHEPIGPSLRKALVAAGLVTQDEDGLRVVE